MSISILLVTDGPTVDPDDWMRRWAGAVPDASMLMLGAPSWTDPARWADAIAREVATASGQTIIVARGRACGAARDAARRLRSTCAPATVGVMFVAPFPGDDGLLNGVQPDLPLACPSVVVTSRSGPDAARVLALARALGSRCVDGGDIGSAGEDARLGDWNHGRHVLNWLVAAVAEDVASPTSTACQGNVVDFAPRTISRIAG
jgi:predicted alpha/beta hydrolase family esterase